MKARTIRSAAHRRILTWLRHGPATVSDIAHRFEMQMPHASLACRQLRNDGLIVRDETGGLRNAPMYLSQRGLDRLSEDALGKLKRHAGGFERSMLAMVLHADETNVVVAYTEMPQTSLIFVPEARQSDQSGSNGNEGGTWVHVPLAGLRWYNLSDFSLTDPPPSATGGTLEEYQRTPSKVGLARGEVFETNGYTTLVEGQRFEANKEVARSSPMRLREGDEVLGVVLGTRHPYLPARGLFAHLPSALDRSLVCNALAQNGLELTDRYGRKTRTLPYEVLLGWLQERHVRMSEAKLNQAYETMVRTIETAPSSLSPSVRRALQMDFGEVDWHHQTEMDGLVDLYGMSQRGVRCLLRHVFHHVSVPFCIDWPFDTIHESMLKEALGHPLCRVLIVRKHGHPALLRSQPIIKSTDQLAVVQIHLGNHTTLEINIETPEAARPLDPGIQGVPSNAVELLNIGSLQGSPSFTAAPPESEEGLRLLQAVATYPQGNEHNANRWEGSFPLASWIASPPKHRASRWVRLHERLPVGWTDLVPVSNLSLAELPLAMAKASPEWQHQALLRLRTEVRNQPDVVLNLVEGLKDGEQAGWYATCLLNVLNPFEPGHRAPFDSATSAWFDSPHCQKDVLEYVFSHSGSDEERLNRIREKWVLAAAIQPRNSLLRLWSEVVETVTAKEPWVQERQRIYMEHLPEAWWAAYAGEWLTSQLNTASGRAWLRDHLVCWPALLYLPEGQQGGFPGARVAHPALELNAEPLLAIKMLGEGIGVASLDEVYEMMYSAQHDLPIPVLASHPFAGWLARPVHAWPGFDATVMEMGDEQIGRLLFARSFASTIGGPSR